MKLHNCVSPSSFCAIFVHLLSICPMRRRRPCPRRCLAPESAMASCMTYKEREAAGRFIAAGRLVRGQTADIIAASSPLLTDAQSQGAKMASRIARGGKPEGISRFFSKPLQSCENPGLPASRSFFHIFQILRRLSPKATGRVPHRFSGSHRPEVNGWSPSISAPPCP